MSSFQKRRRRSCRRFPVQAAERQAATVAKTDPIILRVEGAYKYFPVGGLGGLSVRAVDGVDLEIRRGETMGLVGESGCGKSTLARLITALLPVTAGKVVFAGQDTTTLKGWRPGRVRRQMQMIFPEPLASPHPP